MTLLNQQCEIVSFILSTTQETVFSLNSIFSFIMNWQHLLPLSSFVPVHLPQTIRPLGIDSFNPDFPVSSSLFVLPEIRALSELMIHPALQCHRVHVLNNVLFQHSTHGWTKISSSYGPVFKHRSLPLEALYLLCIQHNSSWLSVCTTALNGPRFAITMINVFSFHSGLLLQLLV